LFCPNFLFKKRKNQDFKPNTKQGNRIRFNYGMYFLSKNKVAKENNAAAFIELLSTADRKM